VAAVVFAMLREWLWAVSTGAVALVFSAIVLLPWFLARDSGTLAENHDRIRVVMSNVRLHNIQHDRLVQAVDRVDPDVLGLVEVNSAWVAYLSHLDATYPYRYVMPDESYRGFALYSKYPLLDTKLTRLSDDDTVGIQATIDGQWLAIDVFLVHPYPPMSQELADERNRQLGELGSIVTRSNRPVVLMGDLNIAMWSQVYRSFIARSGLKNARAGFGVAGTWPATPLMSVPIDHILYSGPIRAVDFRVLPDLGSDHYAVMADLHVASVPRTATIGSQDGANNGRSEESGLQ